MKTSVFAVVAAASGCASSPSPPISQADYDEVARAVGGSIAVGGDLGAMRDAITLAAGTVPAGFWVDGSGTIHGTLAGLDTSYALRCPDQEGPPVCTPSADLAEVELSWAGMLDTPGFSASVSRTGQWSLAYLRSPAIVVAGTGRFTFDTADHHLDVTSNYTHVVIAAPGRLAIAGTIDDTIIATGARAFTIDAEATFHADASATLVLDGTHAYDVDVTTGVVAEVSPI